MKTCNLVIKFTGRSCERDAEAMKSALENYANQGWDFISPDLDDDMVVEMEIQVVRS